MIVCKYSKYSCIKNEKEEIFSPPSKVLYQQFYLPFLFCRLFSNKTPAFAFNSRLRSSAVFCRYRLHTSLSIFTVARNDYLVAIRRLFWAGAVTSMKRSVIVLYIPPRHCDVFISIDVLALLLRTDEYRK